MSKQANQTKIGWTKEQLEAITLEGCNLLVAAAAGSGKTAVLVERIIRKIIHPQNPVDIDKLLVVTFTNAAATEMRERIGEAISKALDTDGGSKQLQRQLTLLHKASITTIHSFCLDVIKNNFHLVDLDPSFRIADETEALLMKMEALEEIFEEKYEQDPTSEVFLQLVECYGGGRDDQKLQDMVFTLYDYVQSFPWPKKWLQQKVEAFNMVSDQDFANTLWGEVIVDNVKIELTGAIQMLAQAKSVTSEEEALQPYMDTLDSDTQKIEVLIKKTDESWDALCDGFEIFSFDRLPKCSKGADEQSKETIKKIRDDVKKRIRKIQKDIFIGISQEIVEDMQRLYPLMECLAELVVAFEKRYAEKKREKALVDFNDLEHYCLQILTTYDEKDNIVATDIAKQYQVNYEEIFIDEYQDSNLVQETILWTISRKDTNRPNVFMVGDVKQSIYRFRQARPDLFLEKYRTYGQQDKKNQKIQLYKNFRSRSAVIHGVNALFSKMMCRYIGELDYDEKEALNLGANYPEANQESLEIGGETEVHLVDVNMSQEENAEEKPSGYTEETEEGPDAMQCEARIIAKRIQQMMGQDKSDPYHVYDNKIKQYRPLEYRDIVILLRATKTWAEVIGEELDKCGIPVYADTNTGYFNTIEVQIMLSLLQVIDNPRQDIALLSVLRSPMVDLLPETLIDIRMIEKEGTFYEAMQIYAAQKEDITADKIRTFLEKLDKWRDKSSYLSTDELLWYLYTDTGYYSYVAAMPGGVHRQANLRILFERARQYEQTSYKGLFNFINFINKLKSSRGDMGSAKILSENDNVVRLMSIHKSKGLEFPVTFVAGLGKQFNMMDTTKSILLHESLGFGPDLVDCEKRVSMQTVAKQALKMRIRTESLSEEMRVLYVALTRAKEKLILTGSTKQLQKDIEKWDMAVKNEDRLPEHQLIKAMRYLDWIGPVLIKHGDGVVLKKWAGLEGAGDALWTNDATWQIHIWQQTDILKQREQEKQDMQAFEGIFEKIQSQPFLSIDEQVQERLAWQYTYKRAGELPVKISVTELKRRFEAETANDQTPIAYMPPLIQKPQFLEKKETFTSAQKGVIMHVVMQQLDLRRVATLGDIKDQVDYMVKRQLLSHEQAAVVKLNSIWRFFESSLGKRMLSAQKTYREVPFNLEIPCTKVYAGLEGAGYDNETILLQGVIDCFFEEAQGVVLIDYKTDYVPNEDSDKIKERYKMQIMQYTAALEKITGKKVINTYIYLFWNGKTIPVD